MFLICIANDERKRYFKIELTDNVQLENKNLCEGFCNSSIYIFIIFSANHVIDVFHFTYRCGVGIRDYPAIESTLYDVLQE